MKSSSRSRTPSRLSNPVMTFLVVLGLAAVEQAQTFTTLYDFSGGSDGGNPDAAVIQDPAGNLYGTTGSGGSSGPNGVVFKLDTAGNETVLHTFSGLDGQNPDAPLVRDRAGNIYGTTYWGGSNEWGTVFKIDTRGRERVLYGFTHGPNGCNPFQGLVADEAGNFYGTTTGCGSANYGTIFKIDRVGKFTLLHSFAGSPSDGAEPAYGHLTMDDSGNLYGLTSGGGAYSYGALYKLSKSGTLALLYSFKGGLKDGCGPQGSVVQGKAGNLYGTTGGCGSNKYGTIWKVSKTGKETILHNFAGGSGDGCYPVAGVTRDRKANLYSVTGECGANGYGALYKLSAKGKLTLLHSFDQSDGDYPAGEVLRTDEGALFGTVLQGGDYNAGTVWSYVP